MKFTLSALAAILALSILGGCAPSSFVRTDPGWKTIALREPLDTHYDKAWQTIVYTVAKQWDIEIMDKETGYLRTTWIYDIGNNPYNRYRVRLAIMFPRGAESNRLEFTTKAERFEKISHGVRIWMSGYDTKFQRDAYEVLYEGVGQTGIIEQ